MLQSLRVYSYSRRASAASVTLILALVSLLASATSVAAQHQHEPPAKADSSGKGMHDMMAGPLGISHVRMGSGTSWMPDSSPMYANHKMLGDWTAMLHGVAFPQYDYQGSDRGDKQLGILDWEMAMLMRQVGTGMLHLHGMVSLEPATIGAKGYPLLLQTGESYKGQPLHDRQHPHDFVMELATMFQQPIGKDLAVEVYGGPAGEPAIGPVAFMHRPSAQSDPFSPLGHHWQDATHISFGVVTAGLYSRIWKLEGSWFNGREPDENRWNLDLRGFDSYSGRVSVNPTGRLSFAGWYGYLASPEALRPDESIHRYGASAMYAANGIAGGSWESSVIWGANAHSGRVENSGIAETNLDIGIKNAVFARAEYVRKSGEDLVLPGVDPERQFDIRSVLAGYVREIGSFRGGSIGVGGLVSLNFVPRSLEPFYGTRTPAGLNVYLRVRPTRMKMSAMDSMSMRGMSMPMSHDTAGARMPPGMRMPPTETHAPGHVMPGMSMPDSSRARRDTATAMPMHDMRNMPGMQMRGDSAAVNKAESTKRDSTVHDATMQHMHDTLHVPVTKEMPGMTHEAAPKTPSRVLPKANATASRPAAKKPSTKATTAKPSTTKKASTPTKPRRRRVRRLACTTCMG